LSKDPLTKNLIPSQNHPPATVIEMTTFVPPQCAREEFNP